MGFLGDMAQPAVCGDHVDAAHVVGGIPVAPGQQAQPAAEGVGDRAHARSRARQRRQPNGGRLVDDLVPPEPGAQPRGAGLGVDPDATDPGGVDQNPALPATAASACPVPCTATGSPCRLAKVTAACTSAGPAAPTARSG